MVLKLDLPVKVVGSKQMFQLTQIMSCLPLPILGRMYGTQGLRIDRSATDLDFTALQFIKFNYSRDLETA